MENVAVRYASCVLKVSDINEHLPTLMRLSVGCGSIAELGVREAVSTWAFLYGLCLNQKEEKLLYCVDLDNPPCLGELRQLTAACGVGFKFFQGDSATTPVPEVDMMFIDTWHVYGHLKRELAFHHARVRKLIVLHDTEIDRIDGESIRDPNHDIDKLSAQYGYPRDEITKGLSYAVEEFLAAHPEWTLKEHHVNNNGLTVLERRRNKVMPTEVYSILSHGAIATAEVLDHKQRNRISIVSIGTEGELTHASSTLLLIHYFLQKYGNDFMRKLLYVLTEHGSKYISSFKPDDTPLEKDVRFLFDVNEKDLKRYPSNVLRAYYGQNTIVNTDLFVKFPHETIMYRSMFKKNKFDRNDAVFFAGEKYSFETMFYSSDSLLFNLISPFGLLRFHDQDKSFGVVQKIPIGGTTLKNALDYIHHTSSAKDKIVFMVCCKGLDDRTMMDFDIKAHPLETIRDRTLTDMMGALKLGDTTEKALTPRKIKTKPKTKKRKAEADTTVRKKKIKVV